jgi:chromate transport protein ChrA
MEATLPYLLCFLIAAFIAILILTPLKRMESLYRVIFKMIPAAIALFLTYSLVRLIRELITDPKRALSDLAASFNFESFIIQSLIALVILLWQARKAYRTRRKKSKE